MATYFINPTGSETPPYGTDGEGAHNFETLYGYVVGGPGVNNADIIEVIGDNGIIVEGIVQPYLWGTVRKHSSSTNKPQVKLAPDKQFVVSQTWKAYVNDIVFFKDSSDGTFSDAMIEIDMDGVIFKIDSCHFEFRGDKQDASTADAISCIGTDVNTTEAKVLNCTFFRVPRKAISLDNQPGGSG